jgi:hypothetical protein
VDITTSLRSAAVVADANIAKLATTPVKTAVDSTLRADKLQSSTASAMALFDTYKNSVVTGVSDIISGKISTDLVVSRADIGSKAAAAGLDSSQVAKLNSILSKQPGDVGLARELLGTANPDRAVRAYMQLDDLRNQRPDRITPDVMRALTMGVGQSRTAANQGREGILSEQQAYMAGEALARMGQGDYDKIKGALDQAGKFNRQVLGKRSPDPQAEKALILKAVSARHDSLLSGGPFNFSADAWTFRSGWSGRRTQRMP